MRINVGEANTYFDPLWVNAYSLLHSQGIYEGQREFRFKETLVLKNTDAFRFTWANSDMRLWCGQGILTAKWSTLRKQIADG